MARLLVGCFQAHSPATSLVIVNLPDPPEMSADATPEQQMSELLEYMNYMEVCQT